MKNGLGCSASDEARSRFDHLFGDRRKTAVKLPPFMRKNLIERVAKCTEKIERTVNLQVIKTVDFDHVIRFDT